MLLRAIDAAAAADVTLYFRCLRAFADARDMARAARARDAACRYAMRHFMLPLMP